MFQNLLTSFPMMKGPPFSLIKRSKNVKYFSMSVFNFPFNSSWIKMQILENYKQKNEQVGYISRSSCALKSNPRIICFAWLWNQINFGLLRPCVKFVRSSVVKLFIANRLYFFIPVWQEKTGTSLIAVQ